MISLHSTAGQTSTLRWSYKLKLPTQLVAQVSTYWYFCVWLVPKRWLKRARMKAARMSCMFAGYGTFANVCRWQQIGFLRRKVRMGNSIALHRIVLHCIAQQRTSAREQEKKRLHKRKSVYKRHEQIDCDINTKNNTYINNIIYFISGFRRSIKNS